MTQRKDTDTDTDTKNISANSATAKQVYIYKCSRKQGAFLYLPEKDNFEALQPSLLELLGELIFSFDFDLTHTRKLIQADAKTVLKHLSETGYFLQLPPSSNFIPTTLDETAPSGF